MFISYDVVNQFIMLDHSWEEFSYFCSRNRQLTDHQLLSN